MEPERRAQLGQPESCPEGSSESRSSCLRPGPWDTGTQGTLHPLSSPGG